MFVSVTHPDFFSFWEANVTTYANKRGYQNPDMGVTLQIQNKQQPKALIIKSDRRI